MSKRNPAGHAWTLATLSVVALVAMFGHLGYWYWPRVRPAIPEESSQVAALVFADTGPALRLWVPYPHQNIGALDRGLGDLQEITQAVQTLLGFGPSALPSFGPFQIPPAKEMAIATDEKGRQFAAAAQVYPVAAWVFRAAGWLAGNPWMSGGDLLLGDRQIHVEWRGNLWVATSGGAQFGSANAIPAVGPSLSLLKAGRRVGPLPEGVFRLMEANHCWVLTSSLRETPDLERARASVLAEDVALSWITVDNESGAPEIQASVALPRSAEALGSIPSFLVLQTPAAEPMRLPGERLLDAVGVEIYTRTLDRWELRAFDETSLDKGEGMVQGLQSLFGGIPQGSSAMHGFVDLGRARQAFLIVAQNLAEVPIVGRGEARRWNAAVRLLDSLAGFSAASIIVADEGQITAVIWPDPVN